MAHAPGQKSSDRYRRGIHAGGVPESHEEKGLFNGCGPRAREGLKDILEKCIDYGVAQFQIPAILKVPPISERGTLMGIAAMFGGAEKPRTAVTQMRALL